MIGTSEYIAAGIAATIAVVVLFPGHAIAACVLVGGLGFVSGTVLGSLLGWGFSKWLK